MLHIYLQMIETDEDRAKFEQIYTEYKGLMFHIAYQRIQHTQDAEDAVHHAFVKIAENIKMIDPVSPRTKQLVVTIVDNRITDILRMRGRHPEEPFEDALMQSAYAEPLGEDLLTKCIFKLPDLQRQVLWLKYHQGYDLRTIAKMLGITLSWAQKIDQRAKKKLEEIYKQEGGTI